MKPKKHKKQRQNIHTVFSLSDPACSALSEALIFLLNLHGFSFENEKINYDSASRAQEKLSCRDTELTRGEVRATAKAVEVVLARLSDNSNDYAYMESDFPHLITNLKNDFPIFEEMHSVLQIALKDLRNM